MEKLSIMNGSLRSFSFVNFYPNCRRCATVSQVRKKSRSYGLGINTPPVDEETHDGWEMIVQETRFIILNNNPLNFERRKVQELNVNSLEYCYRLFHNPLKHFNGARLMTSSNDDYQLIRFPRFEKE